MASEKRSELYLVFLQEPKNNQWTPNTNKILFLFLLSLIFTIVQVKHSIFNGQLSMPPVYDDVVYFNDALSRLDILQNQGFGELLVNYTQRPPHSPTSSLLAFTGFFVFGIHEWVPSSMNFVIIFSCLLFIDYLTRRLNLLSQLLIIGTSLTCRLISHAVIEFRPDIFGAIVTSIAVILIAEKPLLQLYKSKSNQILIGSLAGLALIIKPTFSPVTVILLLSAFLTRYLTDLCLKDSKMNIIQAFLKSRLLILSCIIVISPYYLFAGKSIANYIYTTQFASDTKNIWVAMSGSFSSLSAKLSYYLTGKGGTMMMKEWFYLFVVLAVFAIVISIARKSKLTDYQALPCLIFTASIAYLIPTISEHKQPFLGVIISSFVFFYSVMLIDYIVRFILTSKNKVLKKLPLFILSLLFILGLAIYELPVHNDFYSQNWSQLSPRQREYGKQLIVSIYQDISAEQCPNKINNSELKSNDDCFAHVYMSLLTNLINRDSLFFYHYKYKELDRFDAFGDPMEDNADTKFESLQSDFYNYVVLFNTSNSDIASWLPGLTVEEKLIDKVNKSSDLELLKTYNNLQDEPSIYLYRKIQSNT